MEMVDEVEHRLACTKTAWRSGVDPLDVSSTTTRTAPNSQVRRAAPESVNVTRGTAWQNTPTIARE